MKSFNSYLHDALRDQAEAVAYLNAALSEKDMAYFLVALRRVAEAREGMAKLSRKSRLNRANLYKILSKGGHPEIQSIAKVLDSLGFRLSIDSKPITLQKAA